MSSSAMVQPAFEQFGELARRYNRVPLVATLIGDELTPVSAFARMQAGAERAFLLESVVGGERVARYSFLGAGPTVTLEATRRQVRIREHGSGALAEFASDDPLGTLEEHLAKYRAAPLAGLPRFLGGAVGYAGYDTVRYCERLPNAPADDRGLPDLRFDVYETLVIFDHVRKMVLVVSHVPIAAGSDEAALRTAYAAGEARLERVIARLSEPAGLRPVRVSLPAPPLTQYQSNFARGDFEAMVGRCQEYIRAGDIFQVVVSQRLTTETPAAPFDVYRALRVINPSPFMFYVKSPDVTLVGASPEVMCRVEDGLVTNRPLAGTRPRGQTDEEDRRLEAELLADPKERAEHIMLVDLGRNDVGRVAKTNTVQVRDVMAVERYSHVMHISSTVTGELSPERTAFDALRAALPVGTVSGAPKVRAMEIIDECEPTRRGPYAGAVGYIDFAGNMDTCIALRTLVIQPVEGGGWRAHAQVGAGIVADSVPANEYQETINKAQGLLAAIRMAEGQFGGG
ncbi:MAG: anthranilate synthase component I [Phycisphaerae bacterium]|jgi:anthranilate synthase component 1